MKIAIFINTFAKMANYDLDELLRHNVKLIAITSEVNFEKFQEKYGAFFAEIYCSPTDEDGHTNAINYLYAKSIIKDVLDEDNFIRLICQSEDNLLIAAKLREELSIPGMGYKETLLFRDKVLMKDSLSNAGIAVPKYRRFYSENLSLNRLDFLEFEREFGLPFVLKPTNLLGGEGVFIIRSKEEFIQIMESGDINSEYEIEEFISGTLYHVDAIRKDGKTIFEVCSRYTNPNFDFQLGKSIISLPLEQHDELAQEAFKFNNNVLDILGLYAGVSHHEVFVTNQGKMIFLEIAARSPGAIVTPVYRKAYGIGFEDIAFKIEMDIPFKISPTYGRYYMGGLFPVLPGKVNQLIEPALKSQFNMIWYAKPGQTFKECKSVREKSAAITVWNDNYSILMQDFEYLKDFKCTTVSNF